MKGKAITKIVICSIVTVVLIGILSAGLAAGKLFAEKTDGSYGLLEKIHSVISIGENGLTVGDAIIYKDGESYSTGSARLTEQVRELEIHWPYGSVTVQPYEGSEVVIREAEPQNESLRLRYRLTNGKLTIYEFKSGYRTDPTDAGQKSLEVLFPAQQASSLWKIEISGASSGIHVEAVEAEKMELDTASGNVAVRNCKIAELEVDSASGGCLVEDSVLGGFSVSSASGNVTVKRCKAERFDVDTASGECLAEDSELGSFSMDSASGAAKLTGSVREVEMDSTSGGLTVHTKTAPRKVEFETVSGDCELFLPVDTGFTVEKDGISSDLNIEGFAIMTVGKNIVCGDGAAEFSFDCVSGDVTIRAAQGSY